MRHEGWLIQLPEYAAVFESLLRASCWRNGSSRLGVTGHSPGSSSGARDTGNATMAQRQRRRWGRASRAANFGRCSRMRYRTALRAGFPTGCADWMRAVPITLVGMGVLQWAARHQPPRRLSLTPLAVDSIGCCLGNAATSAFSLRADGRRIRGDAR